MRGTPQNSRPYGWAIRFLVAVVLSVGIHLVVRLALPKEPARPVATAVDPLTAIARLTPVAPVGIPAITPLHPRQRPFIPNSAIVRYVRHTALLAPVAISDPHVAVSVRMASAAEITTLLQQPDPAPMDSVSSLLATWYVPWGQSGLQLGYAVFDGRTGNLVMDGIR